MTKSRKNHFAQTPADAKIKDFLDMVSPSVIQFNVDHYLCGNTYRCVWALREYPTATDEQAILRHLGEKDGITLRIYTRQVTPAEEKRIIHNAANKHRMSRSSTDDLQQTVTAESNLQDVVTLVSAMHRNREPLLHCAVYLELTAQSYDQLKLLQTEVLTELVRSKLNVDRLMLRQQQGFVSVMPSGHNAFGSQFERVLPASSVANLYPFNYSGKTDPQGFYIGKDKYGANVIVDFDKRDDDKTSANILILGIPKRSKGVCLMNIQKTAPTPKLVTMIPADPQMTERDLRKKHLRVAPYCRVSTDKEEQLSSYEAQIEYYTEKIDANPDWTMVRLYADEGITGTSAKKRKDFLQMIRDCERGKIDLVITKSVSRFCRNTLDGLNYVRRLKRHGVGVYFEKENVNTLFMDNEMILTFMMSQAQAESESLSGNVRWGHRKNFKDGKVYYHCKTFLGYRWGADGQPEIDPEQAAIVRRIFSRFLLGHSVRQITTDLMADGIKTATGKTVWHDSVVQKMLCNEKYIGDAILQKTYIADLFTREKRVNNGELPKYYVHDCHPAIIDRETFQKVQEELARRSSLKKTSSKAKTQLGKYCGKYVLSELLVCGECGSPYRRVIWTQKGVKRVVWRCQNRLEHGRKICKQSPTLDEGDIHDAVISAMNELFRMQAAKDAVKAGIAAVLAGEEQTMSLPAVELQIRNLQERQLELFQLIVSAGADCTDYDEELQQVNIAKTRLMAQKAELEKEQRGAAAFESRLAELDMALEQASGTLTDFDELTVRQLVSNIKVLDKDSLLICFKDGTEITQAMQRRQAA